MNWLILRVICSVILYLVAVGDRRFTDWALLFHWSVLENYTNGWFANQ